MKKHILIASLAAAVLSASLPATSADITLKHQGLECSSCHQGGFVPPKPETCLGCHKPDDIVKATERFNFTTTFTNPKDGKTTTSVAPVNPHDNFHYGRTDECVNCHKEHKPSTLTCQTCHDVEPWDMKAPR